MYVQWQGMPIDEMHGSDKVTWSANDAVAKCQEWLQLVQETKWPKKAFNWMEQSCSCKLCASERNAQN